jgi:hypothetical protein
MKSGDNKTPCFLCGHSLTPFDKYSPEKICGICRASLPGRKLQKAILKRLKQIIEEKNRGKAVKCGRRES